MELWHRSKKLPYDVNEIYDLSIPDLRSNEAIHALG